MVRLFIPTRNRSVSLEHVLKFYNLFYPDISIIIADGSNERVKERNLSVIRNCNLNIDYRPYGQDVGYVERCVDVLKSVEDEFIIFGADDDYLNVDLYQSGAKFLIDNSDYVSAMGLTVKVKRKDSGSLAYRYSVPRPVISGNVAERMTYYSDWSFPTSYAVTRRRHLIDRMRRVAVYGRPGFFDFIVGLHDVAHGKLKVIPDIGLFATYSKVHSRLSLNNKLSFLHDSVSVLSMRSLIMEDLVRYGELSDSEASIISEKIILNRIAELCGRKFVKLSKYKNSKHYNDEVVLEQFRIFEDLFVENSVINKYWCKHLEFVNRAMDNVDCSIDNIDENKILNMDEFNLTSSYKIINLNL